MGKLKKKFRSIKKLPNWIFFILAVFVKIFIRCFYRIKVDDPNDYIHSEENFITVVWHNRLMFLPAVFPKTARERTKAVISSSRDGQYIADLVHQFGLQTVRGSSSRKGANAQRGALKAIQENWHVCFTPDGPRGPKYHMHRGPVHLASLTGRPVLPMMVNASRYWQLKSWDNFQVPKPFSTLTVVLGDAVEVPPALSTREELEEWRQKIEKKLMEITKDRD
jgi:hypothetical protein